MATPNPTALIEQLNAVAEDPDALNPSQRQEIIHLSRKAATALEGPFETFQRLAYSPLPLVATRIAQDHGVFKALVQDNNNTDSDSGAGAGAGVGLSVTSLADRTGIKAAILQSLLEYLSTQHMVEQVSRDEFRATKRCELFLSPLFVDGVTHFHDNCLPAFSALNYTLNNPSDHRTAFQVGQGSPDNFYTWMETHPVQQGAFHRFMEMQFASLQTWLDVIPFEAEYGQQDLTDETPLFVDVGGGNGQQCVCLLNKYPNMTRGRIILQDRPAVLDRAVTSPRVEKLAYDYLTDQPVCGARVYYFRQILHNHDDETCLQILRSQIPAMSKSGSVLLIDEKVLPDEEQQSGHERSGREYLTALSLSMLSMFNALERREGEWRRLLAEAGYEMQEIRRFTDFGDSVIVCVKK